ncbi:MAG: DNA translocase FtsK 4TM domain-containing protein [Gemmatimonadota bacterium]
MVSETQRRELLGLLLFALGIFTALSLLPVGWFGAGAARWFPGGNLMGVVGAAFHDGGVWLLGAGTFLVPLIPILGGVVAFRREPGPVVRWLVLVVAFVVLVPVAVAVISFERLAVAGEPVPAAGRFGMLLGGPLLTGLGFIGAILLLAVMTLALFIVAVGWNPLHSAADGSVRGVRALRGRLAQTAGPAAPERQADVAPAGRAPVETAPEEPNAKRRKSRRRGKSLPAPEAVPALGTTGPVVTQYEFVPAPGIKVNRIAALVADLALALKAPSVRIVAPIPGKGAVGIEVPNPERDVVFLRQTLASPAFQRSRGHLPLALGVDLQGRPYVADLDKMPHLLIAGATGSGKSVCINTIVTSLVYRHPPEQLRLLMIDPKMVELSMYGDLPHLRHPVVTDPQDAAMVLKWAVYEMERRYELLSENGARSVHEFNRRVASEQPLRRTTPDGPEGDPDRWLYRWIPAPSWTRTEPMRCWATATCCSCRRATRIRFACRARSCRRRTPSGSCSGSGRGSARWRRSARRKTSWSRCGSWKRKTWTIWPRPCWRTGTSCSDKPRRCVSSTSRDRRRCSSAACASATAGRPASWTSWSTRACWVRRTDRSRGTYWWGSTG